MTGRDDDSMDAWSADHRSSLIGLGAAAVSLSLLHVKTGVGLDRLPFYPDRDPVQWSDVPGEFVSRSPSLLGVLALVGLMLFLFELYPGVVQKRERRRRERMTRRGER